MTTYFLSIIMSLGLLLMQTCEPKDSAVAPNTHRTDQTQAAEKGATATVAFYNIENLYDTLDDTNTKDDDFLPNGKLEWDKTRYEKKLTNIAKVLTGIGNGKMPDIVGLCEVENKSVLQDLIRQAGGGMDIVHFDSPDERGVDVALLYRPEVLKVIQSENLKVTFASDPSDRTRDVLYVRGSINGEELHLFVNHWPSRREGPEKSEPKRMAAASVVRQRIDAIYAQNDKAKIIIMGDLNDDPDNRSIVETLQALPDSKNGKDQQLLNLTAALKARGEGTLVHEGKWNLFDQLIVSGALANSKKSLHIKPNSTQIYKQDWMLYYDKKNNDKFPSRTYGGTKYYGDYSDHLPVYLQVAY